MVDVPLRLLALESATDWLSVAVLEAGRVVALHEHAGSRQHSTALLSVVDATLREARVALEEIGAMAISTGPGSFTSLRIGLATLKGLAFGRGIPVVGVSTLEVMALGVLEGAAFEADGGPEVLALLDARRGEWYAGAWRGAEPPGALPVETLGAGLYAPARLAEDLPRPVVAVCPEPGAWRAAFVQAGLRLSDCVEGAAARPRADRVGRLGLLRLARGEAETASGLSARYLRRAQAEAERTGQAVEAGESARLGPGPVLAAPENVA
ncbi:MAG: tRNA (adenosine(37)-N6)-threonylcarbamoyltransferase complex dimerization subunit type 1 TsaB [Deltaproteobacteria bacterium]|nr:tRNA (adenosine(37)-N6)-threonylcarbamoyltransferase complex dimerization subunit type 1 TsaB [Deltaproteobacteria bacterium]